MKENNEHHTGQKKGLDPQKLQQYLNKEMSEMEQNAFEMEMEADAFSQDAVEGLQMMGQDNIASSIQMLHHKLHQETRKRKKRKPLIAGFSNIYTSIIIILIIAIVTFLLVIKLRSA